MMERAIIILALFLTGAFIVFLAAYSLKNRRTAGSIIFAGLLLSMAAYIWGNAFELSQNELPGMLSALNVEFIGISFIPTFWILLALRYTSRGKGLPRWVYVTLFSISGMILLLIETNGLHNLYFSGFTIKHDGPFPVLVMGGAPLFWAHMAIMIISITTGNVLYLIMYLRSRSPYRKQSAMMLIGSVAPLAGIAVFLSGLSPLGIDITPFTLALTGALFSIGLFRYRMLDLVPLAREMIFDRLTDAVLILDTAGRIVDFNHAAGAVFPELGPGSAGEDATLILRDHKEIVEQIVTQEVKTREIAFPGISFEKYFQSKVIAIHDRKLKKIGSILIMHDITEQADLMKRLSVMAETDELTGAKNRRYFYQAGNSELYRARRYRHPLSVILFDVDLFKVINDSYGHKAGDSVLVAIAGLCRKNIRPSDILCRYGGEEFVIMLPETPLPGALTIAERLRESFIASPVKNEDRHIHYSASFGVTARDMDEQKDLDSLMQAADAALYRAKKNGRNRVESN